MEMGKSEEGEEMAANENIWKICMVLTSPRLNQPCNGQAIEFLKNQHNFPDEEKC